MTAFRAAALWLAGCGSAGSDLVVPEDLGAGTEEPGCANCADVAAARDAATADCAAPDVATTRDGRESQDATAGEEAGVSDDAATRDAAGATDVATAGDTGGAEDLALTTDAPAEACTPNSCAGASVGCGRIDDGCGGSVLCVDGCGISRGDDPLVITGASVPGLLGVPAGGVRAYRWEGSAFVEVAAQVDERVLRSWSPLATELSYVFDHWGAGMAVADDVDPGAIDDDDEIALYAGDAGPLAPDGAWVAGAGDRRQEVFLADPLDGGRGAIYLFTFPSPPPSSLPPIDYQLTDTTTDQATINAPGYRAHYANRWALDETSVAGCGGFCADLIDRFKGRAMDLVTGENEDDWADGSDYVGDRTGPVRALREVKGAQSGVDTTYIGEFYRDRWVNTDYLRVHPIIGIWRYLDYHQDMANLRYDDGRSADVPVDGIPDIVDPEVPDCYQVTSYSDQISSAMGSLVNLIQELDTSAVMGGAGDIDWYYRDDASFDDGTGDSPRSAWGNAGVHVAELCTLPTNCAADPDQACCPAGSGSESHPLIGRITTIALPPAVRQPYVADQYWTRLTTPLQVSVQDQHRP
jgi:hypothetical protein